MPVPAALPRWPLPARGQRVQLRALAVDDLAAFQGYRGDHEVGRYQGWSPMTDGDALAFIASMRDVRGVVPGAWIQLAIAMRETDQLIGDIGIHLDKDQRGAQIGFSCATKFQGRGLASDAVTLALGLLFAHTPCDTVRGVVDARNAASIRLLERLGFEPGEPVATVFRGEPCVEVTWTTRRGNPAGNGVG